MYYLLKIKKLLCRLRSWAVLPMLLSSSLCHGELAQLLQFKDNRLFMQDIDCYEQLMPDGLIDHSAYKSINHHLGNIVVFELNDMNADTEEALFSPRWKNLSIANLEVIETYISTSYFSGVIPILYDGEVETSMMPKVIDESTLLTPYYLLARMSKQLNVTGSTRKKVESHKLTQPTKLMFAKQLQ